MDSLTLFIFLAQFLVTTKIKAKKLVATKNFGRDQFFCLNFGRDLKLGEENEKGYCPYLPNTQWQNLSRAYHSISVKNGNLNLLGTCVISSMWAT